MPNFKIRHLVGQKKNTMINYKKKINKIKTQNFLDEFSIKFLLQHNNFTVKDWVDFRQKIQEVSENSVEILNVKNSLLKKSLLTFYDKELSKNLCQGPNFLIGCKNHNKLIPIWNFLNSNYKLIFISCFYKDQLLTHLDLEILLKTDLSIYSNFTKVLEKHIDLFNTLNYHLNMHPLFMVQSHSITVLELLKESKLKK